MTLYITFREIDSEGRLCYYILQKAHPNYLGIVSVGVLPDVLASAPVAGYNLYVNFRGTIAGNYIPNYKDVLVDIQNTMWAMSEWFYNNRVITDSNKYKKFIIHNDTISN